MNLTLELPKEKFKSLILKAAQLPRMPGAKAPKAAGAATPKPTTRAHKYVKRERSKKDPAKWIYWYKTPEGELVSSEKPAEAAKVPEAVKEEVPKEKPAVAPKMEFTREIKLDMYGDELTNPDTFTQPLPPGITIMDLKDLYKNVLEVKKLVQKKIPPSHPKYNALMHQANLTATNMKRAFGEENLTGRRTKAAISPEKLEEEKITRDYGTLQSKVREYEDQMSRGIKLAPEEYKKYKRYNRVLEGIETSATEAIQEADKRANIEGRQKAAREFREKLETGKPPFSKKFKEWKSAPIKLTKADIDKDIGTFVTIRYQDETGKRFTLNEVKKNNKKVIDGFVSGSKLKFPKGAKIDYVKGKIIFPYNRETVSRISDRLEDDYGSLANENFVLRRGKPGGNTVIDVKEAEGVDWNIKALPKTTLSDSIKETSNFYDRQAKGGKRLQYRFTFATDGVLFNPPDSPEGQSLVFVQGAMRAGKGLLFSTEMNQALGSANGNIVKFYNFDPTGAFWNDMKRSNKNIVKDMNKKKLIGHDGVTKGNLRDLTPVEQAGSIKKFVDNILDQYNQVYGERSAMKEHYGLDNINQADLQIPQAVFNLDEAEQLEDMILTNPEFGKGERKELLGKLAGLLGTQGTTGKKLGITVKTAVQHGFKSDELKTIAGQPKNSLLSLDGGADLASFGSARGWTPAVRRASIGNAVLLETRKPNQDPQLLAPIVPGVGTASALGRK